MRFPKMRFLHTLLQCDAETSKFLARKSQNFVKTCAIHWEHSHTRIVLRIFARFSANFWWNFELSAAWPRVSRPAFTLSRLLFKKSRKIGLDYAADETTKRKSQKCSLDCRHSFFRVGFLVEKHHKKNDSPRALAALDYCAAPSFVHGRAEWSAKFTKHPLNCDLGGSFQIRLRKN